MLPQIPRHLPDLTATQCRDLRDEDIALLERDHTGGKRQVAHMYLASHVNVADIELDRSRNISRARFDGQAEQQLLEQPSVAHANGLAHKIHGDFGLHCHVSADPHEIDMRHLATHRVSLDLARKGQNLRRANLQGDQRVRPGIAVQHPAELPSRNRDRCRFGVEPVHDGGQLSITAKSAGIAAASVGALFGGESDIRHGARDPSAAEQTKPSFLSLERSTANHGPNP